jgi:hypothetical protein
VQFAEARKMAHVIWSMAMAVLLAAFVRKAELVLRVLNTSPECQTMFRDSASFLSYFFSPASP